MTFIRAPYIETADESRVQGARPYHNEQELWPAVQYGAQIGLLFHPELDADNRIREKFRKLIAD